MNVLLKIDHIGAKSLCSLRLFVLGTCLTMLGGMVSLQAQTTLYVTDYGAVGDAVQFLVNTATNSAVVTTTNQLSSADVGKLILLYGAGPATGPTNNQDLIATISAVSNGTNITMSLPAGGSYKNVSALYGTQNAKAFQNCVNACKGTNTIISIPSGNFLMVPLAQLTNESAAQVSSGVVPIAVSIHGGGIHFLGDGAASTVLNEGGAWKIQGGTGGVAIRGQLFSVQGPTTNNYPLIFDGLTMSGGPINGDTSNHSFPASTVDGTGWDTTHDALTENDGAGGALPPQYFYNCTIAHWRGEMVKYLAYQADGTGMSIISNCVFWDGNATAWNDFLTCTITGCTFSNTFQVMEFSQEYYSNACYFSNNIVTNMTGNTVFAFNGTYTNVLSHPYYLSSNLIYVASNNAIIIGTGVAQNIYITSNQFRCQGMGIIGIDTGLSGAQWSGVNSNIVVMGNTFSNAAYIYYDSSGPGLNSSWNVTLTGNVATGISVGGGRFATGYGWGTNVTFLGNTGNSYVDNTLQTGQWYYDDLSNKFPFYQNIDYVGGSNSVSYKTGARQLTSTTYSASTFWLDDSAPSQVPPGAIMIVTNSGHSAPLYFSDTVSVSPVTMTNGYSATFQWTKGAWKLAASAPLPPTDLHIVD